ncbi:MAG: A/G-specific adenine glycosylase [Candidatus Magasanikbacteria bacterium]|jgi:A/G-specific adenine glycosylase|nr:A/G-specific adenine glycosylase [Candidatus Magasanikbacteria bacterium]
MKEEVQSAVLQWYKKHKRDLPWRHTHDPYHILVSEVMLQQTQVARVIEKYHEFLRAFPTVQDLADASTASVITVWKGLGYNRRALFLQKAAQAVIEQHGGIFPSDLESLKALPGIGDYTARAVMSFAFKKQVPMMDTNHRRIYNRVYFGVDSQKDDVLLKKAEEMFPKRSAYNWNQALMDIGSQFCTSRNPKCESCPLKRYCRATPAILTYIPPIKKKKKTIPFKQTDRYFRGRIIDMLREQKKVSKQSIITRFSQIPKARVVKILLILEKDGLIKTAKRSIVLP